MSAPACLAAVASRPTEADQAMLAGTGGPARQLAMRVIVKMAELAGAAELLGIASAHVDGCLFHGYAGLDFAERLLRGGAAVRVPTTLNVASLDLFHPDRYRGDPETAMIRAARDALTTTEEGRGRLVGVNVGTPHFSVEEFGELVVLLAGRRIHPEVELYANTSRHTLARIEARGWLAELEAAGVRLVVDTCTYVTPILRNTTGVVMTSSAKWAWYAPGNIGVRVAFGSLRECVDSAVEGRVVRDDALWSQL